jgi:hypothetical protein
VNDKHVKSTAPQQPGKVRCTRVRNRRNLDCDEDAALVPADFVGIGSSSMGSVVISSLFSLFRLSVVQGSFDVIRGA